MAILFPIATRVTQLAHVGAWVWGYGWALSSLSLFAHVWDSSYLCTHIYKNVLATMNVILSIKPQFCKLIFDGVKRYEYRKRVFKRNDIDKVYVYACLDFHQEV